MTTLRERAAHWLALLGFRRSDAYWELRYRMGGGSGDGSRGEVASAKAAVINRFIDAHQVRSAIEFGCGDGVQAALCRYPDYIGIDVSAAAVALCRRRFASDPNKCFMTLDQYDGQHAELSLSLDVTYHLVEDDVYARHLRLLADAATRYVLMFTTSTIDVGPTLAHVKHRDAAEDFLRWNPDFRRIHEWDAGVGTPAAFSGTPAIFYAFARVNGDMSALRNSG